MRAAIQEMDPEWGVVEMSPADIPYSWRLSSHAQSYLTMFRLLNRGAKFLSPMVGSDGRLLQVNPARAPTYSSVVFTNFHYHLLWWLTAWSDLPHGSMLHPFGNGEVASADLWASAAPGTRILPQKGHVLVLSDARDGRAEVRNTGIRLAPILANSSVLTVKGQFRPGQQVNLTIVLESGHALTATSNASFEQQAAVFSIAPPPGTGTYNSTSMRIQAMAIALDCKEQAFRLDEVCWRANERTDPASQTPQSRFKKLRRRKGPWSLRRKTQSGRLF
jgi:hypothetical protein